MNTAQLQLPSLSVHQPYIRQLQSAVIVSLACLIGSATSVSAQTFSVDWINTTTGDLNGTGVTVSPGGSFITDSDLSGADFSGAPLSASTEILVFAPTVAGTTITFDTPVNDPLFYGVFFRGNGSGVATVDYIFNQAPTILSGFGAGTTSGNTLTVPGEGSGFHNGILQFSGPVSTLTLSSSVDLSIQSLTIGQQATTAVPEPSAVLGTLGAIGLGAFLARRRRLQASRQ